MSKTAQLSQGLRHMIQQGQLRPGDRLPSLRKLCVEHQVSLTTAQRAYAELEKQGLIEALPRSGFRVLSPTVSATRSALSLPAHGDELCAEHLTMALPMPWGCPFMNPLLINTTALSRALSQALRDYPRALADTSSQGYEGLRRELVLHYLAQGVQLDGEELLITCGGMEALALALQAVARISGSDCMLVLTPAFPALFEQLKHLNLRSIECYCPAQSDIDFARLEQLILQHQPAAILAMPNFQHPTGQLMSNTQKAALLALADRFNIPIIEDDTYRELYFGSQAPLPIKALDQRGTVLHCSSFSKSLAPGYRVGWMAAGRFRDSVLGLKLCSSLATPLPSQMAIARLLAKGQHIDMLHHLRQHLKRNLSALQQKLKQKLPELASSLILPQGGYFLWLPLDHTINSQALLPFAMQQGLHFAPSSLFFSSPPPLSAIRLNFSFYHPVQHHDGIELLAALLEHARRGTADA